MRGIREKKGMLGEDNNYSQTIKQRKASTGEKEKIRTMVGVMIIIPYTEVS